MDARAALVLGGHGRCESPERMEYFYTLQLRVWGGAVYV